MLTAINELFVFVPTGMGQTFIKRYATDEAYKKKVSFVEETGEIYTNGKCFGVNCKDAIDELSEKVKKVEDKNSELAELLKGFNPDSIKTINDWIKQHGTEFTTLSDNVTANKASIDKLTSDVKTIQKDLDELNKISVWQEFIADTDMPPVTETTKTIETKESLDTLENTENEDIAVTSNEAMEYFHNKDSKTFKNIIL